MTNDSLRFHLRAQTQSCHAELDEAIGDIADVDAYGRYLQAMHAFRSAAEAHCDARLPPPLADWRPTLLAPLLRLDLDDLGLQALAPPHLDLPADLSSVTGLLYVLEGSALGARLIIRSATQLGFNSTHGARHLALQAGPEGGWREFVAYLDQATEIDRDRAARAAKATFDCAGQAVQSAKLARADAACTAPAC